jgi:AraC-like DNA-binding protein
MLRMLLEDNIGPNDNLDLFGQSIGFFESYADSFWKSTRMELDLVHKEGDTWETVVGRIKGRYCRDLALSPEARMACQNCFNDTCERSALKAGFQSSDCHAGRRFSICSLGEFDGRNLLLLAGRVIISDGAPADERAEDTASLQAEKTPVKSIMEYDASIHLIELSLPYLRNRLKIDAMLFSRSLSPGVRKACRYIDKHYMEKLSLGTLAAACHISKDHLSHIFSKQTGHPLVRYICAVRIGHAMFLLSETKKDITEICFEVGFQSISQFNRTFRAMKGMSPSQFRKAGLS